MANDFVSMFLKKKKRIKLALKSSFILCLLMFVLYIVLHIANVFILSYATNHAFEQLNDSKNLKVEYEIEKNFLKSNVNVKNLKINYTDGSMFFDKINITKRRGIFFPSVLNVKTGDCIMVNKDKVLKFVIKGSDNGFDFEFGNVIGTIDLKSLKIDSITKYIIFEKNDKEAGEVTLNTFNIRNKDAMYLFEYDVDMVSHSTNLIEDISLLDKPIKLKMNMIKTTEKDIKNGYTNEDNEIHNIKINYAEFDVNTYKISIEGECGYGEKLSKIDLDVLIDNDAVMVRDSFNLLLKKKTDQFMKINKMYKHFVDKLIPRLRYANSKSSKNTLALKIYKEKYMPEMLINNISISEILKNLSNDVN